MNFNENRNLALCNISINNPSYPDPFGGLSATNFCSAAAPNVTVLAQNYVNPYSQQTIAGYSHQFTNDLALKVNGVYQHTLRDFRIVDLNYPLLNGVPSSAGVRPTAGWAQILQRQSTGQSKYKALFV